jgi:hypothetical protein
LDTTPVTTLTGRRLPGPSGFLPPSFIQVGATVETTAPQSAKQRCYQRRDKHTK